MTSFGESPVARQVPAQWREWIAHATLTLEKSEIAGADISPDEFKKNEGFYLLLEPESLIETEKLFQALSENGDVKTSLQEMFWSVAYASLVDKFGIPWEISCVEAPGNGS